MTAVRKRCNGAVLAALVWCGLAMPVLGAEWPRTDITPDPAIKQGVLPNGMRYAIMKNRTPSGAVSVRFNLAVGSSYEAADQRGFSHFVEHMAFRGSKNFADGELNRSLERLGLRFGADTNAATGQQRTEYRFDLPGGDPKSIADALAIARDIAGEVTMDAAAVQTETGVIMSEAALRNNPSFRSGLAELQFELVDPRASAMPGSEAAIIQHPSPAALVKFYRAYYRPERAVLTVVGDVDPDQIAAQISARFADWTGVGEAGSNPVFKVPLDRGLQARSHGEDAAPTRVVLAWVKPPLAHPVNRVGWKRLTVNSVAFQIINRRLAAMAVSAEHPFVGAQAGEREARGAAVLYLLSAGFDGGIWQKALEALVQVHQSLLRDGVSQAEIDSVTMAQKAARQRAELSAGTRATSALAGILSADAETADVTVSPAQIRAIGDEDLTGLTPDRVGAALKDMLGAGDPLIFVSAHQAVDEAAILDAYRTADKDAKPLPAAAEPVKWPYTDFGPAGRVVETGGAPEIGVTSMRFSNNVRLLVRPSKARVNQVQVTVKIGDGRAGLPKDRAVASWLFGGLLPGGLGALSPTEMVTALSGKSYRIGFGVGDGAFTFSGETTPGDLETQLQIFAAYIKDAGFRPGGFEQFRQQSLSRLHDAAATPGGIMGLKAMEILHGGDQRWAMPPSDVVKAATLDDLKPLAEPILVQAPIEVVITGDTTVEAASRAVGATLGALAARQVQHLKITARNDVAFPATTPEPVMLQTSAPSPQSLASVSWGIRTLFADLKGDATVRLLTAILNERLLNDVRGQGLSYSVQVISTSSSAFDYGYITAVATMPADKVQLFYDAVDKAVAGVKAGQVTTDDFARAHEPLMQQLRKDMQSNDYWTGLLISGWDDQTKFNRARNFEHVLESVTAEDVAAAARKYLNGDRMARITAGP